MNNKRREVVKKLALAGVVPLVLPGCSWFFGKKKDSASKSDQEESLSLTSSYMVIGQKQSSGVFEVYIVNSSGVTAVSQLPTQFIPHSVSWTPEGVGLVTAKNSNTVLVLENSGKILKTHSLKDEVTSGPVVYWEEKKQFAVVQSKPLVQEEEVEGIEAKDSKKKEKPVVPPEMVFRDLNGEEVDRFTMDRCENVVAMALSENDVVVLQRSKDPSKKPAQVMKYSLEGKHYVFSMMINQPFQPSTIGVLDKKCYIGLKSKDSDGHYVATPVLFFDMNKNQQFFLTSKSNRVLNGFVLTSSVVFSSNKQIAGLVHTKGKQLTFFKQEDQSFFGMVKLEHEPKNLVPTENENEFVVFTDGGPVQIVKVTFEKIERVDVSPATLNEVTGSRII